MSDRYQQLKVSTDEVQSRLRRAHDARQELETASELLTTWMDEVKLDDSPVVGLDVSALQQALSQAKVVTAESSVQKKMMDKLRSASETLKSVGADDESLSVLVDSISAKFARISESAAQRCTELQVAIVRSQGVHEGVDGLLGWIRDVEVSLGSLDRPVHLDHDSIVAKLTEASSLHADIDSRATSIDEVKRSSAAESDSPDVDTKLHDLSSRYERAATACQHREAQLRSLSSQLSEFHDSVKQFDTWILPVFDVLDSRDVLTETQLREVSDTIKAHETDVDNIRQLASEMASSTIVSDSSRVRDTVTDMERTMDDVDKALTARQQEGKLQDQRSEHFEDLRQAVVSWLKEKEQHTEVFEPVAVNADLLNAQMEEIKVRHTSSLFCHCFTLSASLS